MVVAVAVLELHLPSSRSLKDKRRVVKSLISACTRVSGVGGGDRLHDLHPQPEIGIAAVGSSEREPEHLLDQLRAVAIAKWRPRSRAGSRRFWRKHHEPPHQNEVEDLLRAEISDLILREFRIRVSAWPGIVGKRVAGSAARHGLVSVLGDDANREETVKALIMPAASSARSSPIACVCGQSPTSSSSSTAAPSTASASPTSWSSQRRSRGAWPLLARLRDARRLLITSHQSPDATPSGRASRWRACCAAWANRPWCGCAIPCRRSTGALPGSERIHTGTEPPPATPTPSTRWWSQCPSLDRTGWPARSPGRACSTSTITWATRWRKSTGWTPRRRPAASWCTHAQGLKLKIDAEVATVLYLTLVTDTGNFRFSTPPPSPSTRGDPGAIGRQPGAGLCGSSKASRCRPSA
jgi:uncharacterized protein YlxP (DUF503 family)